MRLIGILLALCTIAIASPAFSELIDSTTVYIQSIESSSSPKPLAEIRYNPSTLEAEIAEFFAPELPPESKHVRIGAYDGAISDWKSSTSLTSADSFAKGFQPTIVLSLDAQGGLLGVAYKSAKIDAGQTRDFGPKVKVLKMSRGKLPELNRPVVLSAEGRLEEPEPEKTMLQKYWWVILAGVMLLLSAGGGGE